MGVKLYRCFSLKNRVVWNLDESGLHDQRSVCPEVGFYKVEQQLEAGVAQLFRPLPVAPAECVEEDLFDGILGDEGQVELSHQRGR